MKRAERPVVAVSSAPRSLTPTVYVAWRGIVPKQAIFFRRSLDGGLTFEPAVELSAQVPTPSYPFEPLIAASGPYVYVAWMQQALPPLGAFREVVLARSTDFGATFEVPTGVSQSPVSGGAIGYLDMVVSGANVYVAWADERDAPACAKIHPTGCPGLNVFFSASTDNGTFFRAPRDLAPLTGMILTTDSGPSMAAEGDSVYIAWPDGYGIAFLRSLDGGATFIQRSPALTCPNGPVDVQVGELTCQSVSVEERQNVGWPVIAASASNVYVVWHRQSPAVSAFSSVSVRASPDNGATFAPVEDVNEGPGGAGYPRIKASGNNAYIIWMDGSRGPVDTYFRRAELMAFTGGLGLALGPVQNLSPNNRSWTLLPVLKISGSNLHVAWTDGQSIYYTFSPNGGITWGNPGQPREQAIATSANVRLPSMAALGGVPFLAWDAGPEFEAVVGHSITFPPRQIQFSTGQGARPQLTLIDFEAVQAPAHPDVLVEGKPTVLRMVIGSTFAADVQVLIEYSVDGNPTVVLLPPVHVAPGTTPVVFPSAGVIFPKGASFHASVTIDPPPNPVLPDEVKGVTTGSVDLPVKASGSMKVLFVPLQLPGDTAPSCDAVVRFGNQSGHFIEGSYPIKPKGLTIKDSCDPLTPSIADLVLQPTLTVNTVSRVLAWLEGVASAERVDHVVAVARTGWFRDHGRPGTLALALAPDSAAEPFEHAVIAEEAFSGGPVAAQEIAHNYAWVTPDSPLNDGTRHITGLPAPGYWVNERQEMAGLIDFLNPKFDPAEAGFSAEWVSVPTFDFLLQQLARSGGDPSVIQVRGVVSSDGSIALEPFFRLDGRVDIGLDHPGGLTILYVDRAGQKIAQTGFDPSFAPPTHFGDEASTIAPFAFTIPDVDGLGKILIKRGNQTIAERDVPLHSPTLTLTTPAAGQTFQPGDSIPVHWDSASPDGAPLSHIVSFSRDGGQTWLPIAYDLPAKSISFTANPVDVTDSALVRVTVSDGINTVSATSAPFAIHPKPGFQLSDTAQLTSDGQVEVFPGFQMAVSGSNIYELWTAGVCLTESTEPQVCDAPDARFRSSSDKGISFGATRDFGVEPAGLSALAASGQHVYILRNDNSGVLKFESSADGGATFGTATTIDQFLPDDAEMAATGSQVYVLYNTTGNPFLGITGGLRFRVSSDFGKTFGRIQLVSPGLLSPPQLSVSDNQVHIAWGEKSGLNFRWKMQSSSDGGTTFGPAVTIAAFGDQPNFNFSTLVRGLRIDSSGQDVYAVWSQEPTSAQGGQVLPPGVFLAASSDGGQTFGKSIALSSTPAYAAGFLGLRDRGVSIRAAGSNVYLVWRDFTDVFFRTSADAGHTFGAAIKLTSHGTLLNLTASGLAVEGPNLAVAWAENTASATPTSVVALRTSHDNGVSFSDEQLLSPQVPCQPFECDEFGWAQVAAADGEVYGSWLGDPRFLRDINFGNLFYRALLNTAGGAVTGAPTASAGPDLTVSSGSAVTLVGTGTDPGGKPLTFSWQQTAGPTVTLANPASPLTTFTAPGVTESTVLEFQLTVSNGTAAVTSAVHIRVHPRPVFSDPATGAPPLAGVVFDQVAAGMTPSALAPSTTAAVSPAPNAAGWNSSPVTVTLKAQPQLVFAGSSIRQIHYSLAGAQTGSSVVSGATASAAIPAEGRTTLTYFAVNGVGNAEDAKTLMIQIDRTPPTITGARDPGPNENGWNNGDVTVSFTCNDALSGVATCPAPTTLTDEGAGQAVTGTAVDQAGNSASTSVSGINIDKTPPTTTATVSPAPDAHGVNSDNVTLTLSASDTGGSGVAGVSYTLTGAQTGEVTVSNANASFMITAGGTTTVSYFARDRAGNQETTKTLTVDIARAAPPSLAQTGGFPGAVMRLARFGLLLGVGLGGGLAVLIFVIWLKAGRRRMSRSAPNTRH